ncbi:hypothetical protein GWN42_13655 [candidate division KSB1 bacterium]|nr:hypothetical protein [candidate division KSB1 bacterium]
MDTVINTKVRITFKLPNLSARDDLETKINNFIATQDPGSYRDNMCRETPEDSNLPFWFQTKMFLVTPTVAKVSSARTAILNALQTMPEVIDYEFHMIETKEN